ncbi:hypothetical protein SUGI_0348940 [Cryptomeria japonica]|nr:hypothetical protein SUGI_0348940 [Cryptomeria japonica]
MAEEKQGELSVVMFPWLAHGHITPFLELAKILATHGLKIFFVSTPLNIKRIKPRVLDAQGIELVELGMPSVEGLPPGVESSADVVKRAEAPLILPLLTVAIDLLEKPFETLLQKLSPDFVMYDVMQFWVPRVANPIPAILFLTMGATVVVLSFGSEYNLTHQELAPIAMGLLESKVSFLWVLPAGLDLLPGFQDHIGEKGLVVTKWVPQLHILNHFSIGAFLTHCGWNSMTEGLRFGVPFITLPMQFEQGLNAKLAEEIKVGVKVRRNEEDGSFTKEDISKAIRVLMIEEEGAQIKSNVTKISCMLMGKHFQVGKRNLRNFVSILKKFNK